MTDRSPCQWPTSQPRTTARERGPFKVSQVRAFENLRQELARLRAIQPQITSNLPVGLRGQFLSDERHLADPAVAVFFRLKPNGTWHTLACDRYTQVGHNAQAIALTLGAIRGIERWGSKQLQQQAFSGFAALPPPAPPTPTPVSNWRVVLRLPSGPVTLQQVKEAFRDLAKSAHPDAGGDHDAMVRLTQAMEQAQAELSR